jgi:signal peptidase II
VLPKKRVKRPRPLTATTPKHRDACAFDWGRAGMSPAQDRTAVIWLWVSVVLDQLTKYWAESALAPYQPVPVLPFLNWTLVFNPGAAFSFLSDAGGWQRWLFTALAIGVSGLLVYWLRQTPRSQRLVGIAYALILAGAIGNVIDRIRCGHVVDFIDVHWRGWHFPAFNIADAAITLGAVALIASLLFPQRAAAR